MGKRKSRAALGALAASLVLAAPAMGYGPKHEEGDRAFDVCDGDGGVVDRQVDAGIQAGGGPKSVDVAPTNCDHFWQNPDAPPNGSGGLIGNGWPPPPFVEE
jgi:hypothetical protein